MSRARNSILLDGDIEHKMWQTAHKEFLLKQQKHKDLFVKILVKYKNKYKIKILERTIMDNHIHFIVRIEKLNNFLNFMRDVNSVFAKKLNQDLKRITCSPINAIFKNVDNVYLVKSYSNYQSYY